MDIGYLMGDDFILDFADSRILNLRINGFPRAIVHVEWYKKGTIFGLVSAISFNK